MSLQDALRRRESDPDIRACLRDLLARAPWCWPDPQADPAARAHAESLCPAGPPALGPGQMLLVAVLPGADSLWELRPAGLAPRPRVPTTAVAALAADAWRDAALALPRSLPVLWAPVRDAAHRRPAIHPLDRLADQDHATPERSVDGRSFGLAFLLSLASMVFERALPADLAASGDVDASGAVRRVDGLERKLRLLESCAPGVRRFLVPADPAPALRSERVRVIGVRSAGQALAEVFGEGAADGGLARHLIAQGEDADQRRTILTSLFRLAIGGRGAMVHWEPVAAAAALAAERWAAALDAHDRWTLALCRAVAARHDGNRGALTLPPPGYLERLPAPLRLEVVANLVQHCADTGAPPVAEVTALVERHRVPWSEAHREHLHPLGAHARLLAVAGAPREALARQQQLAAAFAERLRFEEVSFQLSEWYRLAAALGDAEAFEAALEMEELAARNGGLGLDGSPYVDLARARGELVLALDRRTRPPERLAAAQDTLRVLVAAAVPDHVRDGARRILARWLRQHPGGPRLPDGAAAPKLAALLALDEALERGDAPAAETALDALDAREPGLLGHLRASCPAESTVAAWVARFYPY
jgi:hypothetical protein